VKAKIVTPEITPSSETVDFKYVICGQRMTSYIRFHNETDVPCDWYLTQKS